MDTAQQQNPKTPLYNGQKFTQALRSVRDELNGKKLEMADSEIEYGIENQLFNYNESTRGLSWQIPRLDEWTRSKDYLINAATWRANQILGRGIDLNIKDHNQELDDVEYIQSYLKEDLYNTLFNIFYLGYFHGGSGGLIIVKGQTDGENLLKPLTEDSIKIGDFLGIKPLTRLYNIQPCYERQTVDGVSQPVYIEQIGEKTGIYDAIDFGRPAFYRISLNADLYGDGNLKKGQIKKATSYIVHRSHLLVYNSSPLSFIEERVEQFFGTGIGEKAYVSMRRYETLVDQVSLLMQRVNVPVLTSPSLTKASLQGERFQEEAAVRMDGVELSIAYGNQVILGEDETFEYAEAHFTEIPKLLTEYKKQLSSGVDAPLSHVLGEYNAIDDNDSFNYSLDADSERHLRSMYRQLIPLIYRNKFGKKINDFSFSFKSLEKQTEKEKAEVLKLAMEIISIAWKDEVINEGSYHKMIKSAPHNISDMLSELDKEYMKMIRDKESKGDFSTYSTKRIELAIALNREGAYNEVGSAEGGKREGGDPKASKKPTPSVNINQSNDRKK